MIFDLLFSPQGHQCDPRMKFLLAFCYSRLHRRYLVPSPNCVCGAIEDNKHYLLDCHRYVTARDEMLNNIIDIQASQLTFYCLETRISQFR